MRAQLMLSEKFTYGDGCIVQARLWLLPASATVRGSAHRFKYSLFYGRPGERLLCYDNEAGKGDHVHRNGQEEPYIFLGVERLVGDFLRDVAAMRGE